MRAILALAAILLAGCGSPEFSGQGAQPAVQQVDTAGYLSAMKTHFKGSDEKTLLDSGQNICNALESGRTRDGELERLIELGFSGGQALNLVQTSVGYLCPQYANK